MKNSFAAKSFASKNFAGGNWTGIGSAVDADLVLICETTATTKRRSMQAVAKDRLMAATAKRHVMKTKC